MSSEQLEFEAWFRAYQLPVRRFAFRRVGPDAVDDVVAETFLTAWRRRGELDGDPLPWLLGAARRACANQLRGQGRRLALLGRLSRERRPTSMLYGSPDAGLREALSELGDADREALLLVAWDGLSHADAAVVVGCSTSAFSVRVHRARARLAALLAEADERSAGSDETEGAVV